MYLKKCSGFEWLSCLITGLISADTDVMFAEGIIYGV